MKEYKTINKIPDINKYPIEKMEISIKGKILYMISSEMHNTFVLTDNGYFYVINKGKLNDIEGFELKSELINEKGNTIKFQAPEKESQIWCNKLGTHVIIKYNNISFYYNPLMAKKVDELNLINFSNTYIQPYAVAFNDDFYDPQDTGKILISDYNSMIYDLQLKLSEEKELIRLTFGEVFKFKVEKIKNKEIEDEDAEFNFFKMDDNDRILDMKLIVSENPTMGVSKTGNEDKNIFILAITKHILFQFYGKNDFKDVFDKYSLENGKILKAYKRFISQVKTEDKYSRIQLLNEEKSAEMIFGFMTQCGYIMGKFENGRIPVPQKHFNVIKYYKPQRENEETIQNQLIQNPIPKTVCQSKNHIFFLYHDCLIIQNKLTKRIIHDVYLREPYLDMYYNQILNGIILYNEKGIYRIPLEHEFRYLFEDYIEIGNFAKALELLSKVDINLKPKLHKIYADHLFEKQQFLEAASEYAFSDEILEDVCIKFLNTNNSLALVKYLALINHFRIKKNYSEKEKNENNDSRYIDNYLINTWILELLFGINENVKKEELSPNIKYFVRQANECFDINLIYFILNIYGKDKELQDFASLKLDYETIVLYLINQKKINESLTKINDYLSFGIDSVNTQLEKIFLNYANLFIKEYPKETINILQNHFKISYKDVDIIRILLSPNFYLLAGNPVNFNTLIKYIQTLIRKPIKVGEKELNLTKNQNLHNLYILLLSHIKEQNDKGELITYLKKPIEYYESTKKYNKNANIDEKVYFDLYFAKKIFEKKKVKKDIKALCLILYLLKLYSESIDIAINNKFEEDLLTFLVKNIPEPQLQKKIWIQIFESKKQNNNLEEAKKIINESKGCLKIEDILPLIGDNVKISEFKDELKNCISNYERSRQLLRREIKEFNDSNDLINKDIEFSEKKAIKMNYTILRCYRCNKSIKGPKFFLFPCQHIFDAECLIETYKDFNKHNLGDKHFKIKVKVITDLNRKIKHLKEKKQKSLEIDLKTKEMEAFTTLQKLKTLNIKTLLSREINKVQFTSEEESMLKDTEKILFDYLNEECLLCGKEMISSTQIDFGDRDDLEWELI